MPSRSHRVLDIDRGRGRVLRSGTASPSVFGTRRVDPVSPVSHILGVIPLLIASGAGSESGKGIGTAVWGGRTAETVFEFGGGADALLWGADAVGEGDRNEI